MANITPTKGYVLVKYLPENEQPVQNADGSVAVPTGAPVLPYDEKPLCQFEVLSGPKVGQIALASKYSTSNPIPGASDVYFLSEEGIKGYVDQPITPASYSSEDSSLED